MPLDSPIPLQTDTLSTLPGGGIRTITAMVVINDQLTPVQMQVVCIADANGMIMDANHDAAWQEEMLTEMRELRRLVAMFLGVYQPIPETLSQYNASR